MDFPILGTIPVELIPMKQQKPKVGDEIILVSFPSRDSHFGAKGVRVIKDGWAETVGILHSYTKLEDDWYWFKLP